jgi:L-asparaginase
MYSKMEYKQQPSPAKVQPRIIIHGGAGNITPATLTPERYTEFRTALLTIVRPLPFPLPLPLPFSPTTQPCYVNPS